MKVRKELAIWKDRLNEKDDLTEKVSFFWVKESLLPMLEQLQNEIDALNEKLLAHKIE